MKLARVVGAGILGGAAVVVAAGSAEANCLGPTLTLSGPVGGEVETGDVITVSGSGWGDDCYDTGPPPAGEGVLGRPFDDIEIVMTQDGTDHVVARSSADDRYEFTADVVVPPDLRPGDARVQARASASTGRARAEQAIRVGDLPSSPAVALATAPRIAKPGSTPLPRTVVALVAGTATVGGVAAAVALLRRREA
jgi:hypothetical protein